MLCCLDKDCPPQRKDEGVRNSLVRLFSQDPAVCREIVLEESEEEAAARDRMDAIRPDFVGFRFAGGFV